MPIFVSKGNFQNSPKITQNYKIINSAKIIKFTQNYKFREICKIHSKLQIYKIIKITCRPLLTSNPAYSYNNLHSARLNSWPTQIPFLRQLKPSSSLDGCQGKLKTSKFQSSWNPKLRRSRTVLTVIRRSLTRLLLTLSHCWTSNLKQNSPALLVAAGGLTPIKSQRSRSNSMLSNDVARGNRARVLPSITGGA